jgi:hypothetical protein
LPEDNEIETAKYSSVNERNKREREEVDDKEEVSTELNASRINIIGLLDSFVLYMSKVRRTFLAISGTSLIQAPVAIALSLYLVFHPSYLPILNRPDDFGEVLTVLFAIIIASSAFWFITGLKNYKELKRWTVNFDRYQKQKQAEEEAISRKFGLT